MAGFNLSFHPIIIMWASVDKSSMPTVNDIANTKQAIGTLEIELTEAMKILLQAQLRVANLQTSYKNEKRGFRLSEKFISTFYPSYSYHVAQ
jgi:hypothetical protein